MKKYSPAGWIKTNARASKILTKILRRELDQAIYFVTPVLIYLVNQNKDYKSDRDFENHIKEACTAAKKGAILLSILIFFHGCEPAFALTGPELDQLVPKIIMAESSGNPDAVGPGGERGLMQISWNTWKRFSMYDFDFAFDPEKNVQIGRRELENINEMYLRFGGFQPSAARLLYTYNTGRLCFKKHLPRWTKHHPNKIYREIFRK